MEENEMIDYEKKYNEALERAQKVTRAGGDVAMVIVQNIFPELRESEDERIRKDLITYLKSVQGETLDLTISVPKWIAYLEKQKEQKPLSPDEKMNHSLYLEGFDVGREVGKVEAEQKPEDRFEEAREKYQVEWSEEDEKIIGRLRSVVNQVASYTDSLDVNGDYCDGDYAKLDSWLKSLRPSWKPSEEQMDALSYALQVMNTDLSPIAAKTYQGLQEIQQNLRKLM